MATNVELFRSPFPAHSMHVPSSISVFLYTFAAYVYLCVYCAEAHWKLLTCNNFTVQQHTETNKKINSTNKLSFFFAHIRLSISSSKIKRNGAVEFVTTDEQSCKHLSWLVAKALTLDIFQWNKCARSFWISFNPPQRSASAESHLTVYFDFIFIFFKRKGRKKKYVENCVEM